MERIVLIILFCITIAIQKIQAQCIPAPAEPLCNPPGSTELVNGDIVSTGQTKVVTNVASFAGLTMDGGTLIVCDNLTLSSLTFNSGSIYIKTNGWMSITGSGAISMGANSNIYNFGTYNSTQILVTGSNNNIQNCTTTSVFNQFAWLVIQGPNSSIVNTGLMDYLGGGIVADNAPNNFCLNAGSEVRTSVLETRYPNVFDAPSGPACVYIQDRITNTQVLTASSDVIICKAISATESGDYGSATVHSSCSSCASLPVDLISFSGYCQEEKVHLSWTTASEINNDHFEIEKSVDGKSWTKGGVVNGAGDSQIPNSYSYEEKSSNSSVTTYYRLRQADKDGKQNYSPVIKISCGSFENEDDFYLYPNPLSYSQKLILNYRGTNSGTASCTLYNSSGQKVYQSEILLANNMEIDLPPFSEGLYTLQITNEHYSVIKKISIQR